MHGWHGRILHINLTEQTWHIETPPRELYETWIGGKGLAGHYLRPHITRSWDDPDMPLLFFTGPLVDTASPTSGRMVIMSRSPLTGTVGDTSVGGRLGTFIKRTGLDGISVTGRSDSLCGVHITEEGVEFAGAAHLRELTVHEIMEKMDATASVAITGPASEAGVRYACIMIDAHYTSGRGGLALVMEAKNLKFLTVKGNRKTDVFDKENLAGAREEIFRLASASPILKGELGISNFGTGALYDLISSRRMMPTDNFRETYFDNAPAMNAWQYKERYHTKKFGCMGCHILCKKKGEDGAGIPEFETMAHFSALLMNNDIDAVMEANHICNEAGMDTISAASTIACYQELSGQHLSPKEFLALLRDIAGGTGIGAELKEVSYRYAESKGHPEASISVKKLELPAYDPRGAYGMALAYITSTRGGCHLRAYPISHEILRKPVATDRFTFSGKARIIKLSEDLNAAIDSLTACKFLFFAASLEEFSRAYHGVTGVAATAQDLLRAGERIYFHERIMNAMNGFTAADDDLPERFFTTGGSAGNGIEVPPLSREDFLRARSDYYLVRGLDGNGMPLDDKRRELGLV